MPRETDTVERVLTAIKRTGPLTNEQLRERLGLTRGTIVTALRKLIASGEVTKRRSGRLTEYGYERPG